MTARFVHRYANGLMAALLCSLYAIPCAAVDTDAFAAEAVHLQQEFYQVDAHWYALFGALAEEDDELRVIELNLEEAVDNSDLHLAVYLAGTVPVRLRAWTPDWSEAEHRVSNWSVDMGAKKKGKVTGTVKLTLVSDGDFGLEGASPHVQFRLDGQIKGDRISGKVSHLSADGKPLRKRSATPLSGRYGSVESDITAPDSIVRMDISLLDAYQAYAEGITAARRIEELYQAIRAIGIAQVHKMSLSAAQGLVIACHESHRPFINAKKAHGSGALGKVGVPAGKALPGQKVMGEAEALASLQRARKRAVQTRSALDLALAQGIGGPQSQQLQQQAPGDPLFVPFHQTKTPLLADKQSPLVHRLPAGSGSAGDQNWAAITRWRYLGPLPLGDWHRHMLAHGLTIPTPSSDIPWQTIIPSLPAVIMNEQTAFVTSMWTRGFEYGSKNYEGPGVIRWLDIKSYDSFGRCSPPWVGGRNHTYPGSKSAAPGSGKVGGLDYSAYYAKSELHAEQDVELWAALAIQARGQLWLNGKLIWAGPAQWQKHWKSHNRRLPAEHAAEHIQLLKLPFKKGKNEILIRCEVAIISPHFALRICTHGGPRDAAESQQLLAASKARRPQLPPAMTGMAFGGDTSGVFPKARPPVAWNLKAGHNVLWRTKLPYWSNASPVVGGGRVFVPVEPDFLYCLSADTGEVLWKRQANIIQTVSDTAVRQQGEALLKNWCDLVATRSALPSHLRPNCPVVRRSHMYYWEEAAYKPVSRDALKVSDALAELYKKRDQLQKSPDPEAVQDELTSVLEQIDEREAVEAPDPETREARALNAAVGKANAALYSFMKEHFKISRLGGYWTDYTGYVFSTPITDGKRVWWKNGHGVAVCYDLEGNELWKVRHGGIGEGTQAIPSPILVDGHLLMLLNLDSAKRKRGGNWHLVSFSAETGERQWATPVGKTGWNCGSPSAMRLTNGSEDMAVAITPAGNVLRVSDGKMLVASCGAKSGDASVVVVDDVVVFSDSPTTAIRLVMLDKDRVLALPLWQRTGKAGYCGVLVCDGLIHQPGGAPNTRNGPGERWRGMTQFSLETGHPVSSLAIVRKGANYWSRFAASKEHVYFFGGDTIFSGAGRRQPMTMSVLTRGPEPLLLANNATERSYSGAVMDGERLYLRGYHSIACIAYNEAGRRYEAEEVATTLMDAIATRRPQAMPAKTPGKARASAMKVANTVLPGRAVKDWHVIGPFPSASKPDVLAEVAKGFTKEGTLKSGSLPMASLPSFAQDQGPGLQAWVTEPEDMTFIDAQHRRVIDLGRVLGPLSQQTVYLYADLLVTKSATYRYECTTPGTRSWIGGTELASGDRIALKGSGRGQRVPLLVELQIESLAKDGLRFSPIFWASDDPKQEVQTWENRRQRITPYLQAVISLDADGPVGRRAADLLSQ